MTKTILTKVFTAIQLMAVVMTYTAPSLQASAATLADANNDSYSASIGETIHFDVMDNDSPSGLIYFDEVVSYGDASIGSLVTEPSRDDRSGDFSFTAYQAGTYTFTYKIYCYTAEGRSYDTATVTIVVEGDTTPAPNQCLQTLNAVDDTYRIEVGESRTVNVLDNDNVSNNGFFASGTPSGNSSVSFQDNQGPEYTFTGLTEGTFTFQYTIGCPGSTSTQQATVYIVVVDDTTQPPTPGKCSVNAVNDSYGPVKVGDSINFDVTKNDSANAVFQDYSRSRSIVGRLTSDSQGLFNFEALRSGTYTFTYEVKCDIGLRSENSDTATVTIVVEGDTTPAPNQCLQTLNAVDDTYRIEVGESRTVNVLDNDNVSNNGFFASGTPQERTTVVSFSDATGPTYTFEGLREGTFTFQYTIGCPGSTSTQQATVSIVVVDDEKPGSCEINLSADPLYVLEGGKLTLDWNTKGDILKGAVVRIGSQQDTRPVFNFQTIVLNGDKTGTAPLISSTEQGFVYQAAVKCADNTIARAQVKVIVRDRNIEPNQCLQTLNAVDDTYRIEVGESRTVNVLDNDNVSNNGFFASGTPQERTTVVSFSDATGPTYTFEGLREGTFTFQYTIGCPGSTSTQQATVSIVVVDDEKPGSCEINLSADPLVVEEGNDLTLSWKTINVQGMSNGVTISSTDDSRPVFNFSDAPYNGSKAGTAPQVSADTDFIYRATAKCADGSTDTDTVVVRVTNKDGGGGGGQCTIDLSAVPTTVQEGEKLTLTWDSFGRLRNDATVRIGSQDDNRDVFNFNGAPVDGNREGTAPQVSADRDFTYVAAVRCKNGKLAKDTVVVRVTNKGGGGGGSCSAVSANNDTYSFSGTQMRQLSVLDNDSTGSDDTPLEISAIVTDPENGSAIIVGNRIQYTPDNGFRGSDTIVYRAENDCGRVDSATVTITIGSNGGGGGGGGGGILDPHDDDDDDVRGDDEVNLDIFNERITKITDSKFVITWNTNIPASSQVVYGMRSVSNPRGTCGESDLGYQQRTRVKTNRTTTHIMVIDGLTPGAQYFFRPVSDRSDADCAKGRELTYRPVNICEGYIKDFMKIGQYNDPREVAKLQAFLRIYEGANVRLTGTFDAATDRAVKNFQVKYFDEVLQPWGYDRDEATGYVYITTRNKINEIICERDIPLTSAQLAEIAAFRSYWNNQFHGQAMSSTSVATGLLGKGYMKGGVGQEALLPDTDDANVDASDITDGSVTLGGSDDNDAVIEGSITDEEFFLDSVIDNNDTGEVSAEREVAEKSIAGAAAAGIISFIFSLPFLLTVLGILILMLIYEIVKDRKEQQKVEEEITIVEEPVVPTKTQ